MYYDGYGYNFYYGNYGYYEYSVYDDGPNVIVHTTASGLVWAIVIIVLCVFCCCWGCVVRHRRGYVEFESEQMGSMHSNYKVEEVVLHEVVHQEYESPPIIGHQ